VQVVIRAVRLEDASAMLDIYAPYVERTAISFEEEVPALDTFRERVAAVSRTHPWLVAESDGVIAGYAYGTQHRSRASYRWSVEVAVYVGDRFQRAGLGRALYTELFEELRAQEFVNAYAGITLPNDASVRLHESVGFRPIGVFERIGFKLGRWHDVGWWGLRLREDEHPAEPVPPDPEP
jgi:phosphinothricin acetyltransferase